MCSCLDLNHVSELAGAGKQLIIRQIFAQLSFYALSMGLPSEEKTRNDRCVDCVIVGAESVGMCSASAGCSRARCVIASVPCVVGWFPQVP